MTAVVHSQRLERWLGPGSAEAVSRSMRGWYGPRIAVAGVPGEVWVNGRGEFEGRLVGGDFASVVDYAADRWAAERAAFMARLRAPNQPEVYAAGFGGLAALLTALRARGAVRRVGWQKVNITSQVAGTASVYAFSGGSPTAFSAPASFAAGGTALTDSTTGAMAADGGGGTLAAFSGGQTGHLCNIDFANNATAAPLMLFDRLWSAVKDVTITTAETVVTGAPSRYQSTTPGAADSAEGNFVYPEVRAALSAVAHTWTATYTGHDGTTGVTLPTITGIASAAIARMDNTVGWFAPMASGSRGIKRLETVTLNAAMTGSLDWTIGHPLAVLPNSVSSSWFALTGLTSALSLVRVFDNACLSLLVMSNTGTGSPATSGSLTVAYG